MIDFLALLAFFSTDEPRRAIADIGVKIFIETQGPENPGFGRVVASIGGHFDGDSFPDKLVVYSYENATTSDDQQHGLYAVAFFTEDFDTSDILFIPATDIYPASVRGYKSNGRELVIMGKRHVPGDDGCCPSASVSIALRVVDGRVVILKGEDSQTSDRN